MNAKLEPFLKFIFLERQSFPYWGFVIIITNIVAFITCFINQLSYFILLVNNMIVLVGFLFYYISSYLNYSQFYWLVNKIDKNGDAEVKTCQAIVFPKDYIVLPFRQRSDSKIKAKSYSISCVYFEFDSGCVFLFSIYDLGFFKRFVKPVLYCDEIYFQSIKISNVEFVADSEIQKVDDFVRIHVKKIFDDVIEINLNVK